MIETVGICVLTGLLVFAILWIACLRMRNHFLAINNKILEAERERFRILASFPQSEAEAHYRKEADELRAECEKYREEILHHLQDVEVCDQAVRQAESRAQCAEEQVETLLQRNTAAEARTVNYLANRSFEIVKAHGFQDGTINPLPQQLMLIVTEVAEAMEEYRGRMPASYVKDGKPEGVAIELADVVMRVMTLCVEHGWNLEDMIATKMDFNSKRPFLHGGKRC